MKTGTIHIPNGRSDKPPYLIRNDIKYHQRRIRELKKELKDMENPLEQFEPSF